MSHLLAFEDEQGLAQALASALGLPWSLVERHAFPDGETRLRLPPALPPQLVVLRGLQQVLSGRCDHYRVTYPCHSPTEQRWFVMNASALRGSEQGAVVSHFDISPWHALMVAPPEVSGG